MSWDSNYCAYGWSPRNNWIHLPLQGYFFPSLVVRKMFVILVYFLKIKLIYLISLVFSPQPLPNQTGRRSYIEQSYYFYDLFHSFAWFIISLKDVILHSVQSKKKALMFEQPSERKRCQPFVLLKKRKSHPLESSVEKADAKKGKSKM